MTILLTGSAGKTAAPLAELLTPDNRILVASRRPPSDGKHSTVQFDWLDDSTWANVFLHAEAQACPISAVYLVLPDLAEARQNALPFVRLCRSHGVRRFVLLSAWENPEGGALLGGVHAELKAMGVKEGVEWAVLRPHFFMGRLVPALLWPVSDDADTPQRISSKRIISTLSRMSARSTRERARPEYPSSLPEILPMSLIELCSTGSR